MVKKLFELSGEKLCSSALMCGNGFFYILFLSKYAHIREFYTVIQNTVFDLWFDGKAATKIQLLYTLKACELTELRKYIEEKARFSFKNELFLAIDGMHKIKHISLESSHVGDNTWSAFSFENVCFSNRKQKNNLNVFLDFILKLKPDVFYISNVDSAKPMLGGWGSQVVKQKKKENMEAEIKSDVRHRWLRGWGSQVVKNKKK
ncbi:tRNA (guanine(10)-N2)-methyltransferase-like protein, partial [Frankliniella fusca]